MIVMGRSASCRGPVVSWSGTHGNKQAQGSGECHAAKGRSSTSRVGEGDFREEGTTELSLEGWATTHTPLQRSKSPCMFREPTPVTSGPLGSGVWAKS